MPVRRRSAETTPADRAPVGTPMRVTRPAAMRRPATALVAQPARLRLLAAKQPIKATTAALVATPVAARAPGAMARAATAAMRLPATQLAVVLSLIHI